MNKLLIITSAVFLLITSNLMASDNQYAGKVISYEGRVYAKKDGKSRILYEGSELYTGERVLTIKNTRVTIEMSDGAKLTIGDNTDFLIEDYRYNPSTGEGNGVIKMVRGFFRSATGKLARFRANQFKVKTVMAVIGVKGTEFWGGFWDGGKFEVALLDGKGVVISNKAGSVEITNVGWGTTLVADDVAPTPPKPWGQDKINRAMATVGDM